MAQNVNSNTFPTVYKDDFIDSDNYYRILFNSGKKLQARELTQAQSIINKQIQRFGSNIFKDNALIKGGQDDVDNAFEFIRLNTATFPGPADPQTLVGVTFTGQTSNVEFKITKVVASTGSDPLTLYGTYVSTKNSTGNTAQPLRAQANEILRAITYDDLQVENTVNCVGVGSRFMCGEAIYYTKGFFVFTEAQEIILSKYTTNPTAEVGFKRSEQTISADDDTGLYDNQGSEPNLSAPGADRYKISLSLVDKSTLASTDNFIGRATIRNGIIVSSAQIVNAYNVPNEMIATRIFENSGDYLVKPFGLAFAGDSENTHLLANISDGIGVIQGHRTTQHVNSPSIRVPKSTSTRTLEDQSVAAPYANYFEADSVSALAPEMDTSGNLQQQTLKPQADFGGASIGTCYIRHIEQQGSKRRFYIFKLQLNTGSGVQDIKSIGTSTTQYFNVSDGPFNISNAVNSLLFPLPSQRPAAVSNIDYTVQRQEEFTPTGTTHTLSTTGSETFEDYNQWLVTNQYGDHDSAGNPSFAITPVPGSGNTSVTISGVANGELTRVNLFVLRPNQTQRSKILTTVNEVRLLEEDVSGFAYVNLHNPDIFQVTHIEDPNDSSQSYGSLFDVDNGQRDNYYDNGRLILTGTKKASMETDGVRIRYQYFAHQSGNTFFSVNTYSGQVDYKDIPTHTFADGTTINLANVLDFRPTVDSDGTFNTGVDAFINELPKPNGVIDTNVSYYMPRIDRISIDKNGVTRYQLGVSSPQPVAPALQQDAMHLFDVFLNPNTLDPKDLSIKKIDHKRYTMDQINLLEKRLGRLEEITTLSLLENKADTLLVLDATGDIRLKAGFIVDNFKNHAFSAIKNTDYRASLDLASGHLLPKKWEGTVDLFYDSDANNPTDKMKIMGGFIVPKFDTEIYLENDYVSRSMLVNPFQVNSYVGTMELYPSSDTWFETAYLGSAAVSYQGSKISEDDAHKWNSHEWNWKGKEMDELQVGDQTNTTQSTSGRTTTTSWNVIENISVQQVYTGDTLISSTNIQKMRSKKVRFRATGLRPNAKMFAFFDDVPVDEWVRNENFGSGTSYQSAFNSDPAYGTTFAGATEHPDTPDQLETDDNGVCDGSFFIPSGVLAFECGTKKFEIRDVSGVANDNWLSRAVTSYTAQGTLKTYQKNYTSTRIIHIETDTSTYTAPIVNNNSGGGDDSPWSAPPPIGGGIPSAGGDDGGSSSVFTGGSCSPNPSTSFGGTSSYGVNSGALTNDQRDAIGGYGAYSYTPSYTTQSTINSSTGNWGWSIA